MPQEDSTEKYRVSRKLFCVSFHTLRRWSLPGVKAHISGEGKCEITVFISRELDKCSLTAKWECKSKCISPLFQFLRKEACLQTFPSVRLWIITCHPQLCQRQRYLFLSHRCINVRTGFAIEVPTRWQLLPLFWCLLSQLTNGFSPAMAIAAVLGWGHTHLSRKRSSRGAT